MAAGLLEPSNRELSKFDREKYEQYNKERRAEALAIWNNPWFEPVTPERGAAKYLCARGLEAFIGHPALRCLGGILIARVWHVQHGLSAIQRTFLLEDCSDRDRSEHRITEGVLKGGGVWIGAPRPDEEVVVAEGLETLLSALLLLDRRCGVAVLGPNLRGLVLPKTARKIHIAADNDETGIPAARHAQAVWSARGLDVRISHPATEGWDFNNELLGR
jgi:hypothetical protein